MAFFKKLKAKSNKGLLILYGTKSGNAKLVAQQTQKYFEQNGIKSACKNMSGFDPTKLNETRQLLVVVSTHGEGEPPPTAERFFKVCFSDAMTNLHQLNYSICALGDSSYQEFCWAGKVLDKRFTELGARAFHPRKDCDVEFSEEAVHWIKQSAVVLTSKSEENLNEELAVPGFEISKTYTSKIIKRIALTKGTGIAPVYHLAMDIRNTDIQYDIGDSIEIKPENPEWLVDAVVSELLNGEINQIDTALLKKQLTEEYELTTLSNKTIKDYAKLTKLGALNDLLQTPEHLKIYLTKANVPDLLKNYPAKITITGFLNFLPKIKSRKYSIASSQKSVHNELHLTIKTIRYVYQGSKHEGSASVYANEFLSLNSSIQFKLYRNESFRMPENTNTPIIMVGVSTGIAPFRAILHEREKMQITGKTWLIWGNKYKSKDFLYEEEVLAFQRKGVLERLDIAFSCDNGENKYVHEILLAGSPDILDWLKKGAHLYVCGSIKMAHDVKNTIANICDKLQDSQLSLDELITQNRYHEDVY